MTRALVLGGGGPVGIAWEAGLVVGFAQCGVDLAAADRIIGTSAGSNVGAQLALGHDLAANMAAHLDAGEARPGPPAGSNESMASRLGALMEAMANAAGIEGTPEEARAFIGRFALDADTGPEEDFIALFGEVTSPEWPPAFACTAIDATTGEFVVWNQDSGVDLQRAVASSCSVPGIFPPITIDGARYVDGGIRSALNADLASGHDRVLVVSCMSSGTPGMDIVGEVAGLRNSGATVELIEPDDTFVEVTGGGMFLMDSSRMPAAYAAGQALAEAEADRVRAVWTA
jgi:NTE family protein